MMQTWEHMRKVINCIKEDNPVIVVALDPKDMAVDPTVTVLFAN